MKLLFVNQYYWPDSAATAQMLTDLGEHLVRHGHRVHVLCSRGAYETGSSTPRKLPRYEMHNGVHVHRIRATGFAKRSASGRLLDYLSFHALIWLRVLFTGWRYDAIVTLTTPPLVGLCATPVKTLSRTRHICWVMDLHPDLEFELGVFNRKGFLPRVALWLNDLHLRRANACVALGPHMRQRLVGKRVPESRLHSISVWGHDLGDPNPAANLALRKELGLDGKFIVMYSGNAGIIHTFDEVCGAIRELAGDERFAFLFVGSGRRMKEVEAFVQRHGLKNTRFLPYFPRSELGRTLSLGDVHLMTLREGMAGLAVPSKLYGIMAARRPVVFIGPDACESADQIKQHQCGVTIQNGDTAGLIAMLRRMAHDVHMRRNMGASARAAFEEVFTPAQGCEQWRRLLEGLH